jgi:hypothetical protein
MLEFNLAVISTVGNHLTISTEADAINPRAINFLIMKGWNLYVIQIPELYRAVNTSRGKDIPIWIEANTIDPSIMSL